MSATPLHSTRRIFVGALLLLPLYYTCLMLSFSGTVARDIFWTILEGALAGGSLVFVTPVLIRGDCVQRLLALALVALPLRALPDAFSRAGLLF